MPLGDPEAGMRALSCPRCGHQQIRLSRRKGPLLLRLLGFRYFRCLGCQRRFRAWHSRKALYPT
jgi:hypothetical protein